MELQQIKAEKEALEAEKKESEKKEKEAHEKEKEKEAAALAARQQRQAEHQEPRFHKLFFFYSEWRCELCVIGLGSSRYAFGVPRPEIPLALFRQTILTQEEVQGRSNANGLMMSWDVAQEEVGQLRLSIYYIKRKR